jgi:hypothetical protein
MAQICEALETLDIDRALAEYVLLNAAGSDAWLTRIAA